MAAPEKILQPQDETGNVLPELSHVLPCSRKLKKGQLFSEKRQLELFNRKVTFFSDSGQISKFDLTVLQRQWSITDPNTEEKTPEGPGGTPFLT